MYKKIILWIGLISILIIPAFALADCGGCSDTDDEDEGGDWSPPGPGIHNPNPFPSPHQILCGEGHSYYENPKDFYYDKDNKRHPKKTFKDFYEEEANKEEYEAQCNPWDPPDEQIRQEIENFEKMHAKIYAKAKKNFEEYEKGIKDGYRNRSKKTDYREYYR